MSTFYHTSPSRSMCTTAIIIYNLVIRFDVPLSYFPNEGQGRSHTNVASQIRSNRTRHAYRSSEFCCRSSQISGGPVRGLAVDGVADLATRADTAGTAHLPAQSGRVGRP